MSVKRKLAYELHRPARRRYPTRHTTVKGLHDLYQVDLVEMIPYAKENNGYRYIMTLINCFTKVAEAVGLKNKRGSTVAAALAPLLRRHKMKHLHSDQGTEFFNADVKRLLVRHAINHYHTFSDKKAAIVERFNRTLKTNMWREFTAQGNYKWRKLLPILIRRYNATYHRSIGMPPNKVRVANESLVRARLSGQDQPKPAKFEVDDVVRISKVKRQFDKAYIGNWSQELFKIFAVQPTAPPTYQLVDLNGERIKGGFYEHELLKANVRDVFFIEKIIRRKGGKALVRWKGYSKAFDSWIDLKEDVQ
jgi:hypothetical protein